MILIMMMKIILIHHVSLNYDSLILVLFLILYIPHSFCCKFTAFLSSFP
jgi:hypothetical protein